MTHPVNNNSMDASQIQTFNNFRKYECEAVMGALTSACVMWFNPIGGAAVGVFTVTNIGVNLAFDYLMGDNDNMYAKVAKVAFSCLIAIAAAWGVASALVGILVPLTPALVVGIVALIALYALGAMSSARREMMMNAYSVPFMPNNA